MLRWGRVEVTGGFLLIMAWLNYCDRQGLFLLAVCAAAAHEAGHWLLIRVFRGRVALLRLSASGAELVVEGTLSYGKELLCALAGPLVNLLLALGAARIGSPVFAGLNLALGLFNLLPVSALDGGRILSCLICVFWGPERAQRLCTAVDAALSLLLCVYGGLLLGTGGNVTLLIIAVWLVRSLCSAEWETWRKKGLSRTA